MSGNAFEHTLDVIQNLFIPEAQHSVTFALQKLSTALIGSPFAFLAMLIGTPPGAFPTDAVLGRANQRAQKLAISAAVL